MQNIAEFHIIGRVGSININEGVTFVSIATNTNYKKDGDWQQATNWNSTKAFREAVRERMADANKGDLVRVVGNLRQHERDVSGVKQFETELICEGFAILARKKGEDD